jgi:hypothetical protein
LAIRREDRSQQGVVGSASVEVSLDRWQLLIVLVKLDISRHTDVGLKPIGQSLCRDIAQDEGADVATINDRLAASGREQA